jgi:hypothetical protein
MPHGQHQTLGSTHHFLGYRSEYKTLEAASAVRCDNEQIHGAYFGRLNNIWRLKKLGFEACRNTVLPLFIWAPPKRIILYYKHLVCHQTDEANK